MFITFFSSETSKIRNIHHSLCGLLEAFVRMSLLLDILKCVCQCQHVKFQCSFKACAMDMTSEQTSEDGEGQRTWHTAVHGRDSDTTQHISNVPVFRMDTLKGN